MHEVRREPNPPQPQGAPIAMNLMLRDLVRDRGRENDSGQAIRELGRQELIATDGSTSKPYGPIEGLLLIGHALAEDRVRHEIIEVEDDARP
jgi:hypothetical protein